MRTHNEDFEPATPGAERVSSASAPHSAGVEQRFSSALPA